jgi:hypothetical protein
MFPELAAAAKAVKDIPTAMIRRIAMMTFFILSPTSANDFFLLSYFCPGLKN